jgi:hypothetical protein
MGRAHTVLEVTSQHRGVQRALVSQGPRERPTPLGELQAFRGEVQPCASSRCPVPRIRDDGGDAGYLTCDHAQQG